MRLINFVILLILVCSCSNKYELNFKDKQDILRVAKSEELIEERQVQAGGYSLDDKYNLIKTRFEDKFFLKPSNNVLRYYFKDYDQQIAVIDETVFYLFYLANMALAFDDDRFQIELSKTVDDIIQTDHLNGYDGFLPRSVILNDDEKGLDIYPDEIHSNSYSLLMFGYYFAYNASTNEETKALIVNHIETIASYYLKNDLALIDNEGKEIEVSNLNTRHLSRELDALVIFETAAKLASSTDSRKIFKAKVNQLKDKGYIKWNKFVRFQFLNFTIPSHSSNWLNLIRLYSLSKITDEQIYYHNFKKLYNKLEKEKNPFFDALYLEVFGESDLSKKANIEYYLNTFPIELDNSEVISSYNNKNLKLFPMIVKNHQKAEVVNPLPIYQRPLVYFEWKSNQQRIDGNWGQKGNVLFSGLDFLVLYSMYMKLNSTNDK